MKLEAGRELDALVAEKVMGWAWEVFDGKSHLIPPTAKIEIREIWDKSTGFRQIDIPIPAYSENISAAWEVALAMLADGWRIDITGSEADGFDVKFTCIPGARGRFAAEGEVLASTICLAALKAVGVEI